MDFTWFYGGMTVPFTMIPSHSKKQVIIDNLPFLYFPLVILVSTVNFHMETHLGSRIFFSLICLFSIPPYIFLLKECSDPTSRTALNQLFDPVVDIAFPVMLQDTS